MMATLHCYARRAFGTTAALLATAITLRGAEVSWDAGGADDKWTTVANWSDDLAPTSGNDYVVSAAAIESLGRGDNVQPRTYTFGGDSLTITNGSTLYLRKRNSGGMDNVTLEIPSLTVQNSTIESYSNNKNLTQTFAQSLTCQGANTIYLSNGQYVNFLRLNDGLTGSGSIYIYRTDAGSGRRLELLAGDFSGYSGDWTLENTSNTEILRLEIWQSTGWGTGNVTLERGGQLYYSASVDPTYSSNSIVTMTTDALIELGAGESNTVRELIIDGSKAAPGTYTAAELTGLGYGGTFSGTGTLTVLGLPTITWDAEGGNDRWSTAVNWSDDLAPHTYYDYVVSNAVVRDLGNEQGTPKTYTFGGHSLTVRDGGTLYLRKSNSGGQDYVYEEIPNLTIQDATIQQKSASKICYHALQQAVALTGDNTIYFEGGTYGSHLLLMDGLSGSGSVRVYRTANGNVGLGPTHQNSTRLVLDTGDFSAYSGDWTVESTAAGEIIYMLIQTSSGWGSGDMTLGVSAYLDLNAVVTASNSILNMDISATLDLGGSAHTVGALVFDSSIVAAGTHTSAELNTLTASSQFLGAGTLTVSPGGAQMDVASQHGTPDPSGTDYHVIGDSIAASVDAVVTAGSTQFVCTGWVGTGSATASGTSNSTAFTIGADSSIAWQWTTNYALDLTVGSGGTADASSDWIARGTTVTITATPTNGGGVVWSGDTDGCTLTGNTISWDMNEGRSLAVSFPEIITWDAGGGNDRWTTALNWSDDLVPSSSNLYVVDGATVESPGANEQGTPKTYTFGGSGLTVQNDGLLKLNKANDGGTDNVYLNMPNLTVKDSDIQVYSAKNYDLRLNDTLRLEGTCEIKMGTGSFQRWFRLKDGMTGSGSVYLYYPGGGSYRNVYLQSGDFSGYTGDWTVYNADDASVLELFCQTATGWGGGDMRLQRLATLTLDTVSVEAGDCLLNLEHSTAALNLGGAGLAHTVAALVFNTTVVAPGTYTSGELNTLTASSQFSGDGTLTVLLSGVRLDVVSAYGTPDPSGTNFYVPGETVSASVATTVTVGSTQAVSVGWTGTGSVSAIGTTNSTAFSISAASSIAWQWATNYALDLTVGANGTADVSSDWVARGANVTIMATPDSGRDVLWSGDTAGCTITSNTISWVMDAPRTLSVAFPEIITSVQLGDYTAGATWSDGAAPSGGKVYQIVDYRVNVKNSANTTLAGDTLTIKANGILRREQTSSARKSLTTPPLTLDGGELQFTGNNQYSRSFDFETDIAVDGNSLITLGRGNPNFSYNAYLNGALSGSGNIDFKGNGGNSADDLMNLHVTTAANTFSGNWNLWSVDTGRAVLRASAAKALGSGTVTLGVRSSLYADTANGIDSLAGVVLNESSSLLQLTQAWSNELATLSVVDGSVALGGNASTIGSLNAGGRAVWPGTYTSAELNAESGATLFSDGGTLTVLVGPSTSLFKFK